MKRERPVIEYEDELNDEFSTAVIIPRRIDEQYVYIPKNPLWDWCSVLIQNVLSMPLKYCYPKWKLHVRYEGKEKLKPFKKQGYFVYVNHTQEFADALIPSLPTYPKRNFFIVNPENVSMKGLQHLVPLLGALPVPCDRGGMKHFIEAVKRRYEQGNGIIIYPEAHIWPYYTKIRPFKDVSFRYPAEYGAPVFCMTNTYQAYGRRRDKVRIVTYIDGPFYPPEGLRLKGKQQNLREQVYNCMVQRSKNSNIEWILYRRKDTREKDKSTKKTGCYEKT